MNFAALMLFLFYLICDEHIKTTVYLGTTVKFDIPCHTMALSIWYDRTNQKWYITRRH